jgi:hypothetical protein
MLTASVIRAIIAPLERNREGKWIGVQVISSILFSPGEWNRS